MGTTLDRENMDNCFNSIQVCRFRKSDVNRLEMGHYGRTQTLKLHGIQKSHTFRICYKIEYLDLFAQ